MARRPAVSRVYDVDRSKPTRAARSVTGREGAMAVTRRQLLTLVTAGLSSLVTPRGSAQSLLAGSPESLPRGVAAILKRVLSQPASALNTDWFGTMTLLGMLRWRRRG